jgi:dolichol kinase
MHDFLNTIFLAFCFLALFAVAELLYHVGKVRVELTRKLVHLGTGVLTLLFPLLLGNHWLVLFLCSSFAVMLIISLRFKLLPSINAIDRVSYGSLLYPLSVYICYLAYQQQGNKLVLFYLPVLTLAICDPVAALFGKRYPYGKYKIGVSHKTIVGSSAFFLSSCLLNVCMASWFGLPTQSFLHLALLIILLAFLATVAEALSSKGLDNLSIPLCVLGVLVWLMV